MRCITPVLRLLILLGACYIAGLGYYLYQAFYVPTPLLQQAAQQKQAVLFTGEPERIYALRALLKEGFAGQVFVSGVHPQVTQADILPDGAGDASVVMDYQALSTRENAANTAFWVNSSIGDAPFLFMTSRYHMPRSLLLLDAEGLSGQVVPFPVSGPNKPLKWWREYHKWLWVYVDTHTHLSEIIGKIGLNHAS